MNSRIAFLAFAVIALMQSAWANDFPVTPLLDDFDRPDEQSPGGPMWIATVAPEFPDSEGIWVINQKAASGDITESAASAWGELFGQDQEAYFQYGDTPGTRAGMGPSVRVQDPTDRQSDQYLVFFYQLEEPNRSQVRIWKRTAGEWINIASTFIDSDLVAGDQIGLRAVGARITAFFNGIPILEVFDDDPILQPGYLQLYVGDDVGHTADNFGGGTVPDGTDTGTDTPALLGPAAGTTFDSDAATFTWSSNGEVVSQWWLQIGSEEGGFEILNRNAKSSTSTTVTGLPTDGSAVWVRLWWLKDGEWFSADYEFTAATVEGSAMPSLVAPGPGSTLAGATETFAWSANGAEVGRWWLELGTSQGAADLASVNAGIDLSATVTGLPTDGSTVWARLWFIKDGGWQNADYEFETGNALPELVAPSGGTLGPSATFEWIANGASVSRWWLQIGAAQGGFEILDQDLGAAMSTTATGWPTDGSTVWVRLWYFNGNQWLFVDYQFVGSS